MSSGVALGPLLLVLLLNLVPVRRNTMAVNLSGIFSRDLDLYHGSVHVDNIFAILYLWVAQN